MSTGESLSDQILQPLTVEARPHVFATPHPARMLTVDFGEVVRLAGFDEPIISDSTHELEISVYWQALTGTSESYKVFAHLIDSDDRIVAQSDFIPGNGSAPTTSWIEGEIVTDTIRIELPETPQAATYRLVIGLYGSTHGARLPVVGGDGEDYLVLSAITVGK
jgi:hypothetical protein